MRSLATQLPMIHTTPRLLSLSMTLIGLTVSYSAQAADLTQIQNQQIQNQQQRDEALRQQNQQNPNVRIDPQTLPNSPTVSTTAPSTPDTTCFPIHHIAYTALTPTALKDLHHFDFALAPATHGNTRLLGKCLGLNDINKLVSDTQNRIINQGYATTRVVVGNQNLKSGTLLLTIIPGYIDNLKADTSKSVKAIPVTTKNTLNLNHTAVSGKSDTTASNPSPSLSEPLPANFANALPLTSGDLLNIRSLETGLENLKRVPTADADFSIAPSSQINQPGYSDIIINYAQKRRIRVGIGIDDSGSKAAGKYQGNVTLSLDNPTWHNDLLYLTYGHDLNKLENKLKNDRNDDKQQGSENYNLGYSVPVNNWQFNANASHYTYDQTVAGANQDYTYSGESDNITLGTSYLAHRDAKSKTYLTGGSYYKSQKNYIDDTEVQVQRRKVAGWNAGVRHEASIGNTKINADVNYQRGTAAFGAIIPPEELFNEGTNRTGIYKASLDINSPFQLQFKGKPQQFNYHGLLKGQYAQDALVPSERMAIGGRYTVRGFDGERSLSGDNGILLRQELSAYLGQTPHALYLALDAGHVNMKNSQQDELLLGHDLIGAAIGIKGNIQPLHASYDIFTGYPIKQPKGFSGKDNHWASGFSLNFEF